MRINFKTPAFMRAAQQNWLKRGKPLDPLANRVRVEPCKGRLVYTDGFILIIQDEAVSFPAEPDVSTIEPFELIVGEAIPAKDPMSWEDGVLTAGDKLVKVPLADDDFRYPDYERVIPSGELEDNIGASVGVFTVYYALAPFYAAGLLTDYRGVKLNTKSGGGTWESLGVHSIHAPVRHKQLHEAGIDFYVVPLRQA